MLKTWIAKQNGFGMRFNIFVVVLLISKHPSVWFIDASMNCPVSQTFAPGGEQPEQRILAHKL